MGKIAPGLSKVDVKGRSPAMNDQAVSNTAGYPPLPWKVEPEELLRQHRRRLLEAQKAEYPSSRYAATAASFANSERREKAISTAPSVVATSFDAASVCSEGLEDHAVRLCLGWAQAPRMAWHALRSRVAV